MYGNLESVVMVYIARIRIAVEMLTQKTAHMKQACNYKQMLMGAKNMLGGGGQITYAGIMYYSIQFFVGGAKFFSGGAPPHPRPPWLRPWYDETN